MGMSSTDSRTSATGNDALGNLRICRDEGARASVTSWRRLGCRTALAQVRRLAGCCRRADGPVRGEQADGATLGGVGARGIDRLLDPSRATPGPERCRRRARPPMWPEPLLQAARATTTVVPRAGGPAGYFRRTPACLDGASAPESRALPCLRRWFQASAFTQVIDGSKEHPLLLSPCGHPFIPAVTAGVAAGRWAAGGCARCGRPLVPGR